MNQIDSLVEKILKKENLPARVICFFLAWVLWFYVMSIENPMDERNVEIKLIKENLKSNMIVTKMPDTITVRVRGNRNRLGDGLENRVHASIDLTNVEAGERNIPVHVFFSDGEVVAVKPNKVPVKLDTIATKVVPVYTRIVGDTAEDMTLGNIRILPNSVKITGANLLISNISKVVAPVDVSSQAVDYKLDTELIAVSDNGYDVPEVRIEPARVNVAASMVKQMLTVELPVKLVTNGTLPEGVKVSKTEIHPEKVRITAPPSVLKGLTAIETKPMDISNVKGSIAPALELELPEKSMPETSVVQVRISVEPMAAPKPVHNEKKIGKANENKDK